MLREHDAAHTSHRGLDMTLGPWCRRAEIGVEVLTLDVEPAFTCPLHGDAGVLSRTPAVEFCPQISCPRASHCRRARRGWCAALSSTLSRPSPRGAGGGLGQDDEAVDVIVPLPHHVRRGRQIWRVAEQLPGRGYRLTRSSLCGGSGGVLRCMLLHA